MIGENRANSGLEELRVLICDGPWLSADDVVAGQRRQSRQAQPGGNQRENLISLSSRSIRVPADHERTRDPGR